LDPHARALSGVEDYARGTFSYDVSAPPEGKDLARATADQRGAPRAVVIDPTFDWGDDAAPNILMRRSVIYEAHVKGLSFRHPDVPPELRGTYLGVAAEPIVRHLRELGVTAIELLPIHGFVDDQVLIDRKLRNYWGYNSIAFFAPDVRYRSGKEPASEVRQFKHMVKALHAAGIEVILDVVYNHTAEGNHLGPTFSFRGIDNATYYRLVDGKERYYFDSTGTGNSLNVRHPQTLRLLMDSLRYWVEEMHVDGFRFDLASTLARGLYEVERLSSFFTVIHQDPVISRVKLIAEPWDLGGGGYQVGRFPVKWAEWNGRYRDTMRALWRGDGGRAADLGYRLSGSSDLYQSGGRSPASSINFVTAHDGFTLRDLVSYDHKHNEANGEENRDGSDDNLSWNCGVEGDTTEPTVRGLRARQTRNLLATLLLSQGTPMLCGGDEMGRTQHGNNNTYCQDNETSWHDWQLDDERRALLEFTRNLIRLRKEHPLIQRASYFAGREIRGIRVRDVIWFRHDGLEMTDEDWANPSGSSLGLFMAGSGLDPIDEEGIPQMDDDLVLVLNASGSDLSFVLPPFVERGGALSWIPLLDTASDSTLDPVDPAGATTVASRSLKMFGRRALGPGGLQAAYGAPVSTYRVQLGAGFGFRAAEGIVPYLAELGIGGVYTSPYLRAETGSSHGYNVVDHSVLDPEKGTLDDYHAFTDAVRARGMSHVMDFVPNHVGIGSGENRIWLDVLENGPASAYADFFDIEWRPPADTLRDKVLLPVLGRQFGQEVESGRIALRRDGGSLWICYYEKRFPASPRSYVIALSRMLEGSELHAERRSVDELESIVGGLKHLPNPSSTESFDQAERERETVVAKRRLAELCKNDPVVAKAVDAILESISRSPDQLEQFLSEQNYRLAYWRVATEEINYRRFFDVNELAAIRMENPAVFEATHALVLDLVRQQRVTGLRLDHTDGLYDPQGYFQRLQASLREALHRGGQASGAPMYAVAEKILECGEQLPRGWAISGMTGYDFLAAANELWIDSEAESSMTRICAEFASCPADFQAIAYQSKRDVMEVSFSSEVHVLAHSLKRIADRTRRARDFTLPNLVRLLKETIAALPVYRTYVRPDGSRQRSDEAHIFAALAMANAKNPMMDATTFEFLRDVLLLRERSEEAVDFAMHFQQVSGPVMAKGVEDTALYRFPRLLALNEVGSDPSRFGGKVEAFHAHNTAILTRWPLSMTATTTHDTKRSEDVRARLAVLSEIPEEWKRCVAALYDAAPIGAPSGRVGPSRQDAYYFYQTVVGALPFEGLGDEVSLKKFTDRMLEHMLKAVREAKVHTSWTLPNEPYEEGIKAFVARALSSDAFLRGVSDFAKRISTFGAANSLAQTAVRLASPGVPDIYQGTELWDLSLVDPDNRRPVDYERRRSALASLKARNASPELARELLERFEDGHIKLHVLRRALHLRRSEPALFLEGGYEPVASEGPSSEHVVAFERRFGDKSLICAVPRLSCKLMRGESGWPLGSVWGDTRLRVGGTTRAFRSVFTGEQFGGETLPLATILASFPVAWLLAE
jgi:malto-oligosyltrehalose synthase/glycogen debranching enzyme GlgX